MDHLPEISKKELALLRSLSTRGGRKHSGCCRCEGVRAVGELLSKAPQLVKFIAGSPRGFEAFKSVPEKSRLISDELLSTVTETVNSQGIIAVAETPQPAEGDIRGPFILALDQLNDPGNFGTIARTFRAIGGAELWYTKGSVDPWCDKAIRSGMGAQFSLRLRRFDDLPDLVNSAAKRGFINAFIADPHEGESCFTEPRLFDKSVIIIGSEANGVTCHPEGTGNVMIPMPGNYESLNAAQAATVLLLEHVRRTTAKA
ncbi:MAG: RNA methyltransferase [Lentisphaeria bacterium]|nr:RNA methyltransferase [Lentisphaeria bacterium]